ncbi:DUF1799 domain-containing protein [Variovorax ginsengisoli]|uniref:DUF1799 domain-containing protein n=1 Tax=Variovorax ginsengisoli TaxID=363844 RepID=A0ABT8SE84_9BURK|nr:DUF1799 domain-containing protein [Variovorax ginsengisoli]MDN8617875.1 DUF1799 domain-containing protein [Variovorax ginsengisoli]MDO1537045.1 DUF1799 domain-containing protein [Variovorax ginsengisoli]
MTVEEMSGPPVELWPCNVRAVHVFSMTRTQWRYVGMAGVPVGLIYSELPFVLEMEGIDRSEWPQLFAELRVMERSALDFMRAQNQ